MPEPVEYAQLTQDDASGPSLAGDLTRLSDIPMELAVEIGRTRMTVGETLQLHVGSVIELGRQAGEPVDLLVNGTAIARGEVVVVDERYGLRVTELLDAPATGPAAPVPAGEIMAAALPVASEPPAGDEPAALDAVAVGQPDTVQA